MTDDSWRDGVRTSWPLALPTLAVGLTFGLLTGPLIGVPATIAMSALVWSGTAQFAALSVISGGGGVALAAASGLLANLRFVPMGFAVAPSVTGGALRRIGVGASLVDASFAMAQRGGGRFSAAALVGAMPVQYGSWLLGTAVGALGTGLIADPDRWGLDVMFPVFYLSLLLPALRERGKPWLVAGVAAVITVVLTPVAPPGVPILVASLAALIGLKR